MKHQRAKQKDETQESTEKTTETEKNNIWKNKEHEQWGDTKYKDEEERQRDREASNDREVRKK